MGENFLIREGRPDELDEIVALVKTAYREFKEYFPAERWEAWMENIRETVHAGAGVLIVAEERGRIRGVVKFYPFANQARMGHWPRPASAMRILAVHPDSRGQGYGTLLTRECINRARALKIHRMFLYTGTFMQAARHIYESLGFKRAPEFDRDPGPIAYRLDL